MHLSSLALESHPPSLLQCIPSHHISAICDHIYAAADSVVSYHLPCARVFCFREGADDTRIQLVLARTNTLKT